MGFEWLNKLSVRSSEEFSLERMHRFFYHYVEGARRMQVNTEGLQDAEGRYGEEIDIGALQRWLPPHESEPVSPEKQAQIRHNIVEALAFMDVWCRFTRRSRMELRSEKWGQVTFRACGYPARMLFRVEAAVEVTRGCAEGSAQGAGMGRPHGLA